MSKAHQNWKQFLLTEEVNDLNALIADEVSKYDDIHPSGRPYEQEFDNDETIKEQKEDINYEEALELFKKKEYSINNFNKSIVKMLSSDKGIHGISDIDMLMPLIDNMEKILKPLDAIRNRSRVMYYEIAVRGKFVPLNEIDYKSIMIYDKLIEYANDLSIKLFRNYSKILETSDETYYYFKVRNAIMLFTGASVPTVREPSNYKSHLAGSGLIIRLNNVNLRFIYMARMVFSDIQNNYIRITEYYDRNPRIEKADFTGYRSYDNISSTAYTYVEIGDDRDKREDVIEQHNKYKDLIMNLLQQNKYYLKHLTQIKRDATKWKDDNNILEVSEKKQDYVFANGFLKYAANMSPPAFVSPGTMAYRGMAIKTEIVKKIREQIAQGSTNIIFPGKEIASWTIDLKQAKNFALENVFYSDNDLDPLKYSMVILSVPATKGIYVGDYSAYPNEKEIISGGNVVVEKVSSEPVPEHVANRVRRYGTRDKLYIYLQGRFV